MNSSDETKLSQESVARSAHSHNETMLRSEIQFWREMIESSDDSLPRESVERMQQALALAEFRLANLFEACKKAERAYRQTRSNVFRLQNYRKNLG